MSTDHWRHVKHGNLYRDPDGDWLCSSVVMRGKCSECGVDEVPVLIVQEAIKCECNEVALCRSCLVAAVESIDAAPELLAEARRVEEASEDSENE